MACFVLSGGFRTDKRPALKISRRPQQRGMVGRFRMRVGGVEEELVTLKTAAGCNIFVPPESGEGPLGVVHFVPGAVVSETPLVFYSKLLKAVSRMGFVVVMTPYETSFDHGQLANDVANKFLGFQLDVLPQLSSKWLPTFGMGHSLGAKLHVLMNSDPVLRRALPPRAANILISYNNFDAEGSIPAYSQWAKQLEAVGQLEPILDRIGVFDRLGELQARFPEIRKWNVSEVSRRLENLRGDVQPTPGEVRDMLRSVYCVNDNLVISFINDDLDQSDELESTLRDRFGQSRVLRRSLVGTHVTPMTPEMDTYASALKSFTSSNGWSSAIGDMIQQQLQTINDERAEGPTRDLVRNLVAYLTLRLEDINRKSLRASKASPIF